mgnify:CR=1 FL=1
MIKIIWISGISGTGKTTLAKYYLRFLKNFLWIDGDKFRKLFNNDLGYTLSERNKNAERLINFVEFIEKQNINIIVSANLTSNKYQRLIKKKFKNLVHIKILAELNICIYCMKGFPLPKSTFVFHVPSHTLPHLCPHYFSDL